MSTLSCGRSAMGICAAISILAGCGGREGGDSTPSVTNVGKDAKFHQNFFYTDAEQTFTVPAGVTTVRIDAKGASGGGASGSEGSRVTAGPGGEVKATIPVTPGERLGIFVGGAGETGDSGGSGGSGGYNGGAPGGAESYGGEGAGGGGASDVRQGSVKLSHRIVIAGGGGGAGGTHYGFYEGGGSGGLGGGTTGGNPCYSSSC
ncbi:MAG: glycine-rich protein, partial [Candidatus Cybelea sp.]